MALHKLRYHLVDVFTDYMFGGNQLAVFTNARGLSATFMQAIANEMNLSETTFVLPPENPAHDYRIRIFTPVTELPMAGHPTIGTSYVLAKECLVDRSDQETCLQIQLEEEIGVIPVTIQMRDHQPELIWMEQPLPTFGSEFEDVDIIAEMLNIDPGAIRETGLPMQVVSCGVPFLFIPIQDLASIRRVSLRREIWEQVLRDYEAMHVFVFTRQTERSDGTVHCRMFAPALGINEDPATGGASGPLGCYLVHHKIVPIKQTTHIISEQGIEMGRPSTIHIEIGSEDDKITGGRVGGTCCSVGEGFLEI